MSSRSEPILLVEDDENDVALLQRAVKRAGIVTSLQVVRNGEEAIAYLDGNGQYEDRSQYPFPVLMLLDLNLPGMTGLEVLARVRERHHVKRMPVVVLSASKTDEDVNQAYELGANSYVVKPMSFDMLSELVKSLELYWLVLNERPTTSHSPTALS